MVRKRANRDHVSSVVCSYDGESLAVKQVGQEIQHDKGRGLLEPSLNSFQNRFFLTLTR